VSSTDGTAIAYDVLGDGPPLVVVGGMFCARDAMRGLCEQLATGAHVVNYDRRGRGDSGDAADYAVDREIDDLAALIDAVGGSASVYGHSSGAALALRAAARGIAVDRLVLHEPPYGVDTEEERQSSRRLAIDVRDALSSGRPGDAIAMFMSDSGLPDEVVQGMSADPGMQAIAPTMNYDFAVMDAVERGGTIPSELVEQIDVPTLVVSGGASPDFFRITAGAITATLPDGRHVVLDGQDHGAPADVVAPVVLEFLREARP
jgi:pimeloyl-ACP methyl ester carboxylesterase